MNGETFAAAAPERYAFFGVHLAFDDQHDVFVPDVPCANGAGATFDEAMEDAVMKLTCELEDLRIQGLPIPAASPRPAIEHVMRTYVVHPASGAGAPRGRDVVRVTSDPASVPHPSAEELEEIKRLSDEAWRSIVDAQRGRSVDLAERSSRP